MAYTEQILYQLQLPQFLNKFKEACLGQLLPPIEFAIDFLKTTSNPLLMVLLAILFVELVRLAILQVGSNKAESVPQTGDSRATAREVKDLKRELKGMQKTVQELKELGVSTSAVAGRASAGSSIEAKSVIDSCKDSWVKREEIALHIVQYQTLLMNEVRQLKRGGSRINSTSKILNSSLKEPYANVQGSGPAVNGAKAGTKAPVMAKKAEVPVMFEQNPPIARSNKVQTQPPVMKNRQQARREEVKPQITKVKQQKIKQLPKQPEIQLKNEEMRLTTIEKSSSQLKQTSPKQNTFKNQEYTFENKLITKSQVQTIQQIKIEQTQTANLQETTEEKQVTIDQPPKVMPPLPRQPPSTVRRAPVPPSKGQKRNPPPPPMRKT